MNVFDYDAWAGERLESSQRAAILSWKAAQLETLVPAGMTFSSALEIGCAEGYVINHIKERFAIPRCYGADISERFLSRARSLFPDITFLKTNKRVFPFADDALDLVVLSDIVEHVPDLALFLAEARRIGRYTLVRAPIDKYWWRALVSKPLARASRVGSRHPDGHLYEYSGRDWLSLFRRHGFALLASRIVYHAPMDPLPEKQGVLRARWFIDRELKRILPRYAHYIFGGSLMGFFSN